MSNKIQSEIGAKNAMNLGFGGSGVTNLLVALRFATSFIEADDDVKNILLIASDVSIPGNRVINPDNPMTVLGDGASAMIVSEGKGDCEIIKTEIRSNAQRHDAMLLPGGGIAHPDKIEQYRLKIDIEKNTEYFAFNALRDLSLKAVQSMGASLSDVAYFVGPNISLKDQRMFAETFELSNHDPFEKIRRQYGHVHATDLVVNLSKIMENGGGRSKELGLVCSHGWGFQSGVMLIKF